MRRFGYYLSRTDDETIVDTVLRGQLIILNHPVNQVYNDDVYAGEIHVDSSGERQGVPFTTSSLRKEMDRTPTRIRFFKTLEGATLVSKILIRPEHSQACHYCWKTGAYLHPNGKMVCYQHISFAEADLAAIKSKAQIDAEAAEAEEKLWDDLESAGAGRPGIRRRIV